MSSSGISNWNDSLGKKETRLRTSPLSKMLSGRQTVLWGFVVASKPMLAEFSASHPLLLTKHTGQLKGTFL